MSLYFEKYHLLAKLLIQMREELIASQINVDKQKLRQNFTSLKHFYLEEILSAKTNIVNNSSHGREQSYLTEISKQIRLLEMDITFFHGARQTETFQNRFNSICERLNIIIKYCDALTHNADGYNQ